MKENEFINNLDDLFDIAHANALHLMIIEEEVVSVSSERKRTTRTYGTKIYKC